MTQFSLTRADRSRLDELEPLWTALHNHHAKIDPSLGGVTPTREAPESWTRRRAKYELWLEDPDAFFLMAEADGKPVGYAFVMVGAGLASWRTGERLAELETLSVLAAHRKAGVGAALVEGVWRELATIGVVDLCVNVALTNVDARRFYEREGLSESFVMFYGKAPGSAS